MEDPVILTKQNVAGDVLLCQLCGEHFTNPRVLPCQHTFCCSCLSTYCNDCQRRSTSGFSLTAIPCPTCRTLAILPVLGVSAFPSSPKMARVCDLLKYVDKVQKDRKHKSNATEDPLLGPQQRGRDSKNVRLVFKDARTREHESADKRLDPENLSSSSDSSDETSDDNLEFETFHSYVECGVTDSSSEDIRQYEDIEHEKNLKNELNANASEEPATTREDTEDFDRYSSHTVHVSEPEECQQEEIQQVNSEQAEYDSGVEDGATTGRNEEVDREACPRVAEVEEIDEDSKDTDQEKCDMGKETLGHIYATPQLYWQLQRRDYEMPTSTSVMPCGKVIVGDYGKCFIEIYEQDGTFVRRVEGVKPFSMCVNCEGRVVVGDRMDKTVKIYEADGEMYDQWSKGKFDWICGIGQNKATNLVIYDRKHCKVGFYDDFENCISSFGRYGDKKDIELCMADFLTIDEQDRIIICDSGSHCVKVFSDGGQFLHSFGSRGSRDGELLWPKGVATDSLGNIIVTDQRNDRVSMFSADGVFIQHLVENCPRPYNVSCANNLLVVSSYELNGHSNVAVYKLSQLQA